MSEERDDLTIGEMRTWGPDGPLPEEEAGEAGGMEGGWDPSQTIGELETLRPEDAGEMLLAGRYKVVRRLGEGGMGSVWLAEDTKLDGRRVAVKMLPAVLAGKKGAYRRVKQEALMAMRLSHPNIATVRAFEEDEGGNPFLVMDYIEGEGLDEILEEKGELSEEETVRLLGPVAAALDYAHSQGVVHRDVKPGNVMVRKDGTPFVLDFGIAREIQETMTRVTGKFSSGTLLYMSPEQLHGRAPKAAQDVYSFAAMAYECLKGGPPFARGQIEYQIDHDAPEPLEEGVASKALREGILAGLAKEPEGRPGSCAGVLAKGGASQGGASTPCEPENGTAAGSAAGGTAGKAAGRTARPEGSPHQEERPTVRPLPNADAATAGGRDENVFLRKVRVGRALEEEIKADEFSQKKVQKFTRKLMRAAGIAILCAIVVIALSTRTYRVSFDLFSLKWTMQTIYTLLLSIVVGIVIVRSPWTLKIAFLCAIVVIGLSITTNSVSFDLFSFKWSMKTIYSLLASMCAGIVGGAMVRS